jgi:DNA polymerase
MAQVERGYSSDLAAQLASTLEWWTEAGVDCLVEDEARDWLKAAPILPGTGRDEQVVMSPGQDFGSRGDSDLLIGAGGGGGGGSPPPRGTAPPPPGLRPATSPSLGGFETQDPLPDQLPLLLDWFRTSDALPYATPSAPRVCPSGDPAAGLMILAAMPSGEDCASGTLVSGAAGRLFDRMLAAIGRSRETAYLAGLSCLRPAGGRLDPAGASRCAEIARHHIALAEPKAVLLLGDACSRALLGLGAAEARGRVHSVQAAGRSFNAVVTLHPDFLLTQPGAKAHAWADLQLLMEVLP